MHNHQLFHCEVNKIVRDTRYIVGNNIRAIRTRRHLTLEKLGKMAKLNPDTIDRIELGKGNLDLTYITRLSLVLQTDVIGLFCRNHT